MRFTKTGVGDRGWGLGKGCASRVVHWVVKDRLRWTGENGSGSLAEGLSGGRDVLFGVDQAQVVGGPAGDFGE